MYLSKIVGNYFVPGAIAELVVFSRPDIYPPNKESYAVRASRNASIVLLDWFIQACATFSLTLDRAFATINWSQPLIAAVYAEVDHTRVVTPMKLFAFFVFWYFGADGTKVITQ